MRNPEKVLKFYKLTSFVLLGLMLVVFLLYKQSPSRFCPSSNGDLVQKAKPTAESKIDRSFEFPVKKFSKDKLKIKVVSAQRVKLVTMKNQPITAKEGEDFLLLYLEIENNLETHLIVDSQNYFRLAGEGEKKLAPDFFNGEIQVSAISTKQDQIGFIVNANQNDFKLQVGEIEGLKEIVDLKL